MKIHPLFVADLKCNVFVIVLDQYTTTRKPDSVDQNDKPKWSSPTYTELGQAIHNYQAGDLSCFDKIVETAVDYLRSRTEYKNITHITNPPSFGRGGSWDLIVKEVANKYGKGYLPLFEKESYYETQGKSLDEKRMLANRITCVTKLPINCELLIIDDVVDTGATFEGCLKAIERTNKKCSSIKLLALTQTHSV